MKRKANDWEIDKDGLSTPQECEDYAMHHYIIILPVVDKAGREWLVEGQPVSCLHGSQYETVEDQRVHVAPCPECGGMGMQVNEPMTETDCVRCTSCGLDFDDKLEMMES